MLCPTWYVVNMRISRASVLLVSAGVVLASLTPMVATAAAEPDPVSITAGTGVKPALDDWPTASDELTFLAVLPYDRSALRRFARQVSTPGNARFRAFSQLSAAGREFGASRGDVRALRSAANAEGVRVDVADTRLTAWLSASTATWERLYGMSVLTTPAQPEGVSAFILAPPGQRGLFNAEVPAALAAYVPAMIPVFSSTEAGITRAGSPPVNRGEPFGPGAGCLDDTLLPLTYSPNQIHVPYGTKDLHADGLRGQGSKLAIIGIGQSYSSGLAEIAGECFGYRMPPLDFVGVPGIGEEPVPAPGVAGVESNLDVQSSSGVLPQAEAISFVEGWGSMSFIRDLIDAYTVTLTEVNPDVITLSYGSCDRMLRGTGVWPFRRYMDDVFAMAGIVGTSVLVAAGDSGTSGCLHQGLPIPGLRASYPSGSPWVTAVGGSRLVLGADNQRVKEVVWNSSTWDPGNDSAGAGGPTSYPAPWYQRSVSSADRRMTPDIVAHAAESPGWPVAVTPEQFAGFMGVPLKPGQTWGMVSVGGTSAASPYIAAHIALLAAQSGRLGFINPWLYSLAANSYNRAYFDITEGGNLVAPEASCCKAVRGYDGASGLGSPKFGAWRDLLGS